MLLAVASHGAWAHADGAADAMRIDITGEISTAGFTGGVGDPAPIFAGSPGPVIFVMNASPAEAALTRAHRTRIRANPELNRR